MILFLSSHTAHMYSNFQSFPSVKEIETKIDMFDIEPIGLNGHVFVKEFNWRPNSDCQFIFHPKAESWMFFKSFLNKVFPGCIWPCQNRTLRDYFSAFSAVAAAVRQCLRGMKWTAHVPLPGQPWSTDPLF